MGIISATKLGNSNEMTINSSNSSQNHPLYSDDRDLLNNLIAIEDPKLEDLANLARIIIRYQGFPGADDLKTDTKRLLNIWNLTVDELNSKTKELWESGFRPGYKVEESVGSSFDTMVNESG